MITLSELDGEKIIHDLAYIAEALNKVELKEAPKQQKVLRDCELRLIKLRQKFLSSIEDNSQ